MIQGIYEELITQLLASKINELQKEAYFVNKSKIDAHFSDLNLHLKETQEVLNKMLYGKK